MKKKHKTNFQKYLERRNLSVSTDTSKLEDEVRSSNMTKFYQENLENFHEVDSVRGMKIFSGVSEDGKCIITEHGGFFCESTGLVANPVKFLLATEKFLTEQGAYDRFFKSTMRTFDISEGVNHHALDREYLFERINSFRRRLSIVQKLESFGVAKENVDKHPFWFDGLNRFFYLYNNRLNYPVCKHEWRFDGNVYSEEIYGAPRLIESPEADRIFFVENPMQLVSMSELYPEPVYVRPTAWNYLKNDYSRLIRGKQVICMKSKNPRNADPTTFDLSYLESNDPLDLLQFYDQGEPMNDILQEGMLGNHLKKLMDEALDSINKYIKEKKHTSIIIKRK